MQDKEQNEFELIKYFLTVLILIIFGMMLGYVWAYSSFKKQMKAEREMYQTQSFIPYELTTIPEHYLGQTSYTALASNTFTKE